MVLNSLTTNKITSDHIKANSITGCCIAANTITAWNVAANTITGNELMVNTVKAANLTTDAVFKLAYKNPSYDSNRGTWSSMGDVDLPPNQSGVDLSKFTGVILYTGGGSNGLCTKGNSTALMCSIANAGQSSSLTGGWIFRIGARTHSSNWSSFGVRYVTFVSSNYIHVTNNIILNLGNDAITTSGRNVALIGGWFMQGVDLHPAFYSDNSVNVIIKYYAFMFGAA